MKTKSSLSYKPYEHPNGIMPHRMMDTNGKIGAVLFGSIISLWNLFTGHSELNFGMVTAWAAVWFVLKFAGGAVIGGILGKVGGDLYTNAKLLIGNFLRKRKNKKK